MADRPLSELNDAELLAEWIVALDARNRLDARARHGSSPFEISTHTLQQRAAKCDAIRDELRGRTIVQEVARWPHLLDRDYWPSDETHRAFVDLYVQSKGDSDGT